MQRFSGVLAPALTPFSDDLQPDAARFAGHCRWLTGQGVDLALFGTTSEANSLSVDEKESLLDALIGTGIDPDRIMAGTGCCALTDTERLTRHAVRSGCRGVLMLPPFYYRGAVDEGLYRYFAEIIERVADERLAIYLYHIPPVAGIGLSPALIERLAAAYPGAIAGIKDSSGDWDNTRRILELGIDDFRVFVGSENFLLDNMRHGGAGCISATVNVRPAPVLDLYRNWQGPGARDLQQSLIEWRKRVQQRPMIAALKAIAAHHAGDRAWRALRPPLSALAPEDERQLLEEMAASGLEMPGYREALQA